VMRALKMEFFVQEIVWRKFESQDSYSDDDVSAISGSDSDILETVEKADFVDLVSLFIQTEQTKLV
jgi:hypothetical protein